MYYYLALDGRRYGKKSKSLLIDGRPLFPVGVGAGDASPLTAGRVVGGEVLRRRSPSVRHSYSVCAAAGAVTGRLLGQVASTETAFSASEREKHV